MRVDSTYFNKPMPFLGLHLKLKQKNRCLERVEKWQFFPIFLEFPFLVRPLVHPITPRPFRLIYILPHHHPTYLPSLTPHSQTVLCIFASWGGGCKCLTSPVKLLAFPWPYSADKVSQPTNAWMKRIFLGDPLTHPEQLIQHKLHKTWCNIKWCNLSLGR